MYILILCWCLLINSYIWWCILTIEWHMFTQVEVIADAFLHMLMQFSNLLTQIDTFRQCVDACLHMLTIVWQMITYVDASNTCFLTAHCWHVEEFFRYVFNVRSFCHTISCLIIPCHIISCHNMAHHVKFISCHILSNHTNTHNIYIYIYIYIHLSLSHV